MVFVWLARTVFALNNEIFMFLFDFVIDGSFNVLLESSIAELGIVTFALSVVIDYVFLCFIKRLNGELRRPLNNFGCSNIACRPLRGENPICGSTILTVSFS